MRVFISFASRDREAVRQLEAQLRMRRPDDSFFLDERTLTSGVYWIPLLGEELGKADVVLLLLGETIGPWQELEYYEALQLSRQVDRGGRPRIIAVVIADRPSPGLAFLAILHQVFALDLRSSIALLRSQLSPIDGAAWPVELKDSRFYVQLTMRPGRNPVKELAVSLIKLYGNDDAAIDREASDWTQRFRDGSYLYDTLRLTRDKIDERQGGYTRPIEPFMFEEAIGRTSCVSDSLSRWRRHQGRFHCGGACPY